ncbi:Ferritin Dps family protein [Acidimicrobium ferrooxidans DSM 10331]|uniref:Ferritin Dps family protein n=1 Tax=Acidimicrobium ferrooxidans (strain DSM 10331 / JCM 15462 / NBRC 103882 / ICP) TaxID=525909 RepID=C7M1Z8_ACIFD|nr:ferritin-like domain-containing protein [Acidimicrobium ferrooxidans]ACU53096.1 Ferritin Dps family protein [Acidimicrobium ferrooxidans DSM 10331]
MTQDHRLAGFVVRALRAEIIAVEHYLAQASLVELWGYPALADRFSNDARDELDHQHRILRHAVSVGIAPRAIDLPPLRFGRSVEELVMMDRAFELDVVRLYGEAVDYCGRMGPASSLELFAGLYGEEVEHLASIDALIVEIRSERRGRDRG